MDEEQTLKAIEVMQAFTEGKSVEFRWKGEHEWRELKGRLASWDWVSIEYRIKEPTKPSINWDHVHPDYNWMATDVDGRTFLYTKEPTTGLSGWMSRHWVEAHIFA